MMSRQCQLRKGCAAPAPYDIVTRDRFGQESRRMCCFHHGIVLVNLNHDRGHPIHDCVITPVDGIRMSDANAS